MRSARRCDCACIDLVRCAGALGSLDDRQQLCPAHDRFFFVDLPMALGPLLGCVAFQGAGRLCVSAEPV